MEKRNKDGLNAYDILRIPECPITLPKASSMTQAGIDYRSREESIFQWYELNKRPEWIKRNRIKISFLFAWYDIWVGIFWDSKKKWLYILPLPCLGIIIKFTPK